MGIPTNRMASYVQPRDTAHAPPRLWALLISSPYEYVTLDPFEGPFEPLVNKKTSESRLVLEVAGTSALASFRAVLRETSSSASVSLSDLNSSPRAYSRSTAFKERTASSVGFSPGFACFGVCCVFPAISSMMAIGALVAVCMMDEGGRNESREETCYCVRALQDV